MPPPPPLITTDLLLLSLGGGGGRTLGTERKKGGLSKAEERQSHTLAAAAASESEGESGVCVSVSVSEAWWSGCRSQGSTGSGVRLGPQAAPTRSMGLQLPECRLPGGRNGEAEAKGGSERKREGRKQGASGGEGGRA